MPKPRDIDQRRTLDLHGAFVRRLDLSGASLGADLTEAKNLTLEQLAHAIIDSNTALPTYIDRAKLDLLTSRK